MSSSSHKGDDGVLPLYHQGGSLSKVGYFKATHFKINSDDSLKDFLEAYRGAISSEVHVKHVKGGNSCEPCSRAQKAIKFHPYYLVLGFTFPMLCFFQEMLCSMKCTPTQFSPNVVRVTVGFLNLSQFFDLDLTVNEFLYFFDKGHIDGVGQLRSCHRLFNNSTNRNHDWAKETLEISGEWESDSLLELPIMTIFITKMWAALRKKIKQIKAYALAYLVTVKRSSLPAKKILVKNKLVALESSLAADRLVIYLTSSKRKKDEVARSKSLTSAMPKIASTIDDRIAQHRGFIMTPVSKSVPRCPLRAKSSSSLERLTIMKSDKVDPTTKVEPRPTPLASETSSPTEKEETAHVSSYLPKDMDTCANLADGVRWVICPSSFAKHTTQYRRTTLLAMKQKTMILAAESMLLDQKDTKAAKEMATKKELRCYIPQIQNLEHVVSELRYVVYEKDEELIATYNQVILFKKIVGRLERQVLDLQGVLKINENLKKEVYELQRSQADFYKLGYVDHLFGRPSDFMFARKNFETFSISLENLIAFTFEASIGEVVGEVGAHAGGARGEALDDAATERQAVGSLLETIGYLSALGNSFRVPGQSSIGRSQECLVGCFGLLITLEIPRCGHMLLDAIFLEELLGDIGPTMSITHCMNGQGPICRCSSLAGSADISL
ncbi:hypothetical protein D8674_010601 [Pyrus ussuriensis x Pyrus communis]|uniref:Uncharacterized protein n=1 Tax=Pyrus ussuriensis x Pyrus communis TaxID=2448454 RepID=A0A5N5FGI1_9ROSA|nr:hypothetical protein D8674_010601 [Pyrus ussuriensis x Pyrus communis]